ncbi:hypothetical protein PHMEG_00023778 [Phytophthora megakarya]|uniref:Uncharacterized protein n=1 Tax=Phytophthora megakarya TaxID=4795 RepID=A0A225VHS9_9STRA|nr:hypothetical protein PHMEG_00023778 [Phytophthora megakarya]
MRIEICEPTAAVPLQDLSRYDTQMLESIGVVQRILFAACYKLETEPFNVNTKVLDILNPESPAVQRIESSVTHAGCTLTGLLARSTHLADAPVPCKDTKPTTTPPSEHESKPREPSHDKKMIDHQAAVIRHLIENSKRQDARMDELEAKLNGDPMQATRMRDKQEKATADVSVPKKKQRRGSVTYLHATWISWYTHEPCWQLGAPK